MVNNICQDFRDQVMYFIDNELSEDKRIWLVGHINQCKDCQAYLGTEKEIKSKICDKLKDSYICQCDIQRLKESIKGKINEIVKF